MTHKPHPVYRWVFGSMTFTNKTYETLRWSDSSLSCDCPGWTRRAGLGNVRTCKHVRMVQSHEASYSAIKEGRLVPMGHSPISHNTAKSNTSPHHDPPHNTTTKPPKRKLNME